MSPDENKALARASFRAFRERDEAGWPRFIASGLEVVAKPSEVMDSVRVANGPLAEHGAPMGNLRILEPVGAVGA